MNKFYVIAIIFIILALWSLVCFISNLNDTIKNELRSIYRLKSEIEEEIRNFEKSNSYIELKKLENEVDFLKCDIRIDKKHIDECWYGYKDILKKYGKIRVLNYV